MDIFQNIQQAIGVALTVGGLIVGGYVLFKKLSNLIHEGVESITSGVKEEIRDLKGETFPRLDKIDAKLSDHDSRLQAHEKEIAYIKGKEDARAELAQAARAVSESVVAMTHEAHE